MPGFYQSGRQSPFFHTKAFEMKQRVEKTKRQQMPEPRRDEGKLFPLANFCTTLKAEHFDSDKVGTWQPRPCWFPSASLNVSLSTIATLILPVAGLFFLCFTKYCVILILPYCYCILRAHPWTIWTILYEHCCVTGSHLQYYPSDSAVWQSLFLDLKQCLRFRKK